MKPKLLLLGLLLISLCTVAVIRTVSSKRIQPPPARTVIVAQGVLKSYAKEALEKGQNEVILASTHNDYIGGSPDTSLDSLSSEFGAVIVEPVMQLAAPYAGSRIVTWYKFRVLNELSPVPVHACLLCDPVLPPQELLPLLNDEFILSLPGGRLSIDGVTLSMRSGFKTFQTGQQYLLFISKDPANIATLAVGPEGVFRVSPKGDVEALSDGPHRVKRDIKTRFNNSTSELKQHLARTKKE